MCYAALLVGATIVSLLDGVCTTLFIMCLMIFLLMWTSLMIPGMDYRYLSNVCMHGWVCMCVCACVCVCISLSVCMYVSVLLLTLHVDN